MIPSANDVFYFSEVAHTLNISRAAERLGISQPSLSLAIQRLEHSFGVPLLIRTKTGVQLTKGGQRLLGKVRVLMEQWNKLKADALRDEESISGHFTLGMHPSVALFSLRYFLPLLLREHADLQFKLTHNLSRKIAEDVISFKCDFGLVVNPPRHPDLVIKKLFTDTVTLWRTSSDGPINDDVLLCDTHLIQTEALLKKLEPLGINFKRVISSTSLEVIADLCGAGAGIAILPSRVATHSTQHPLRPFLGNAPRYLDEIALIYRADAQQSKASKKIIAAMIRWSEAHKAEPFTHGLGASKKKVNPPAHSPHP